MCSEHKAKTEHHTQTLAHLLHTPEHKVPVRHRKGPPPQRSAIVNAKHYATVQYKTLTLILTLNLTLFMTKKYYLTTNLLILGSHDWKPYADVYI